MNSDGQGSSSYSSQDENEEKLESTNNEEDSTPPLSQSDKLSKYLDKVPYLSADDVEDLKKLSIQQLVEKSRGLILLSEKTNEETVLVLEEKYVTDDQIFELERATATHRSFVNAVAEEHEKNCKKLSALQFTYNNLVDDVEELEYMRLKSIEDVEASSQMLNEAKKLAENILRKRDREVNKKRIELKNKTEQYNLQEEKKSLLKNGISMLEKELADLKQRKKEALEAQSQRHAKARNLATLKEKRDDLSERLRNVLKQKQEKAENLKAQQQRVDEKKGKAKDMVENLNETKARNDALKQKIEEGKAQVRQTIATRFSKESERIDQANKDLVMKMQGMLNFKTDQEILIADMQKKMENTSVEAQSLAQKVSAIQEEVKSYEERIKAIPTKNAKLSEEHDKMQSKLNGLQQTNINLKMKLISNKADQEKQIIEAKKKKQLLTKQLFPDGKNSSFELTTDSEASSSVFGESSDTFGKLLGLTPAVKPPFVLHKVDVLKPSASRFDITQNSIGSLGKNDGNKKSKKRKKKNDSQ